MRIFKGFRANQGLLLAGAVAYYALLSIVPLLILLAIALSHVIEQSALLEALGRYIGWLAPGQSKFIVNELSNFLAHREVMGWVLLATMLFFLRSPLPCSKTRCRLFFCIVWRYAGVTSSFLPCCRIATSSF